jgi:hypothetical protein
VGYAKNPGGLWDTIGTVALITGGLYFMFWFFTYSTGTMDLFWDVTNVWLVPLKTFMVYQGGIALVVAALVLSVIFHIWRNNPYEE